MKNQHKKVNIIFLSTTLLIVFLIFFLMIETGVKNLFGERFLQRFNVWFHNRNSAEYIINENNEDIILENNNVKESYFLGDFFNHYKNSKIIIHDDLVKKTVNLMPFYYILNNISKGTDKLFGQNATTALCGTYNDINYAEDIVLELSHGNLVMIMDNNDIDNYIDKTVLFAKKIESENRNFIYLDIPPKIDVNDKEYLEKKLIYQDHTDECRKIITDRLKKEGIIISNVSEQFPCILNKYEYFFKNDYHWKPEAGLIACKALANTLNDECGYDIDVSTFNKEKYDSTNKLPFFGSLGNKVSMAYSKKEEITVLLPKFETNISVSIRDLNINKTGKIQDTLYDWSKIEKERDIQFNSYSMYSYGNRALIEIHNNLINNGKKLLIVKESMANVMIPFLATTVEDMSIIDLRHYQGSLEQYIEKMNPDTVVMIYGTGAFTSPVAFNFN